MPKQPPKRFQLTPVKWPSAKSLQTIYFFKKAYSSVSHTNVTTEEANNMLTGLFRLTLLVQPSEQMKLPLVTYKWNGILRSQGNLFKNSIFYHFQQFIIVIKKNLDNMQEVRNHRNQLVAEAHVR